MSRWTKWGAFRYVNVYRLDINIVQPSVAKRFAYQFENIIFSSLKPLEEIEIGLHHFGHSQLRLSICASHNRRIKESSAVEFRTTQRVELGLEREGCGDWLRALRTSPFICAL